MSYPSPSVSLALLLPHLRPIQPLLADARVTEIMVNPDGTCWVEREGKLEPADVRWPTLGESLDVIAGLCRQPSLGYEHPHLNAQIADGSRLSAVVPPVSKAPALVIRKFPERRYTVEDLIGRGMLSSEMASELERAVREKKMVLISGGTGSGKTTLLAALADHIPRDERVVLIEDTAELRLIQPNLLSVEAQPHVTFEHLLKASLRWRPDRIIVGEVRGPEARTLLDSLNTGHAGSLATIHANSAEKALSRFALLVMRHHPQTRLSDVEQEVAQAVDVVVHVDRTSGRRTVEEVLHVRGYDRAFERFQVEPIH